LILSELAAGHAKTGQLPVVEAADDGLLRQAADVGRLAGGEDILVS
jgi:hypothetical protein